MSKSDLSKACVVTLGSLRDSFGVFRSVGEIWLDQAGNECFFRENGSISCKTVNNEPSETIQSEKDACDLNYLIKKYGRDGILANVRTEPGQYGDFSSAVDYHDSVLRAQQAEESFMRLPADIRVRFYNDPGKLIDFLADDNNRSEAESLGLVASPQVPKVPLGDVAAPSEEGV